VGNKERQTFGKKQREICNVLVVVVVVVVVVLNE
jgi:hypothetical protein